MDQDVAALAREIAVKLTDLDAGLSAKVEAEILASDPMPPQRKFDAAAFVGIASLVLGAAQFAYQIQRDRKQDSRLKSEQLKRRLRLGLEDRGYPDTTARARIIEAVVQIIDDQLT